jgi:hypothetical protein
VFFSIHNITICLLGGGGGFCGGGGGGGGGGGPLAESSFSPSDEPQRLLGPRAAAVRGWADEQSWLMLALHSRSLARQ